MAYTAPFDPRQRNGSQPPIYAAKTSLPLLNIDGMHYQYSCIAYRSKHVSPTHVSSYIRMDSTVYSFLSFLFFSLTNLSILNFIHLPSCYRALSRLRHLYPLTVYLLLEPLELPPAVLPPPAEPPLVVDPPTVVFPPLPTPGETVTKPWEEPELLPELVLEPLPRVVEQQLPPRDVLVSEELILMVLIMVAR